MSEKLIVEIKAVIKLTLTKMRIPHFKNTDIYFFLFFETYLNCETSIYCEGESKAIYDE